MRVFSWHTLRKDLIDTSESHQHVKLREILIWSISVIFDFCKKFKTHQHFPVSIGLRPCIRSGSFDYHVGRMNNPSFPPREQYDLVKNPKRQNFLHLLRFRRC